MFEKFFEHYESEEHEVIVIIGNCRGVPSKNAKTNIYQNLYQNNGYAVL